MDPFPSTAADFYAKRDNRTNACIVERSYQDVGCAITVDRGILTTAAAQVLLHASCNLLARWCRRVEITLDAPYPTAHGPLRSAILQDALLGTMYDADPFGNFEVVSAPTGKCRIHLHIGNNLVCHAENSVCTTSSGWLASVATNKPSTLLQVNGNNMIGAIGAACLSGAQLFKLAINVRTGDLLRDGTFDLLSMQRTSSQTSGESPDLTTDLGRLLLIGAGSVGSSAAYWLKQVELRAEMQVLDGDDIKVENFNRSPMFGRRNYGANKAIAVADHLDNSRVRIFAASPVWWDALIAHGGRPQADAWLPLANDFDVRWSIQNNFPPLAVHASTGSDWLVNFGRHIPLRDDCLADRFPRGAAEPVMNCSQGPIPQEGKQVDAALPFLSFFAGLLVTADLARLTLPGYPQAPNFAAFDFGSSLDAIQGWNRLPRAGCICTSQTSSLHEKFNGNTQYRRLFQQAI